MGARVEGVGGLGGNWAVDSQPGTGVEGSWQLSTRGPPPQVRTNSLMDYYLCCVDHIV
jgi:hypothetical protein